MLDSNAEALRKFKFNSINSFLGKIEFIHKNKADKSSAFNIDENVELRIYVPYSIGINEIYLCAKSEFTDLRLKLRAKLLNLSFENEIYQVEIDNECLPVGIYFCYLQANTIDGKYYSFGSYDGAIFKLDEKSTKKFQITKTDFKYVLPKSKKRGIIYHIFVDRFAKDSQALNDNEGWKYIPEYPEYPGAPIKNDKFFGGTLHGIISKLDYIKSLGTSLIYLSPIFSSPSNHRYDTSDYMSVDEKLGGDAALVELIKEAKIRDIGIILDGVFNHTGADSIYFNKYANFGSLGAYQSKKSDYYNWYFFEQYPDKYECWWGIDILPRINPDIESCRQFFLAKGGVIEKYAKMGVLGFRLDVADELSDDFIKGIKQKLSNYGCRILYGEVWEDASNKIAYDKRKRYYLGDELDGVMNYPLREGLINYVKHNNSKALKYALTDVFLNAPMRISYMQMNLLGSHDTERILTVLGEENFDGPNSELRIRRLTDNKRKSAINTLKALYTVLVSLPGIPTVYYGDEAGLEGYSDPFNRMPYPWGGEDLDLLSFYRKLGKIRREISAFSEGDFSILILADEVFAFKRELLGDVFLTVFNNGSSVLNISSNDAFLPLINNISEHSYNLKPKNAEIFKVSDFRNIKIKRK